jgi:hypothetical protein
MIEPGSDEQRQAHGQGGQKGIGQRRSLALKVARWLISRRISA